MFFCLFFGKLIWFQSNSIIFVNKLLVSESTSSLERHVQKENNTSIEHMNGKTRWRKLGLCPFWRKLQQTPERKENFNLDILNVNSVARGGSYRITESACNLTWELNNIIWSDLIDFLIYKTCKYVYKIGSIFWGNYIPFRKKSCTTIKIPITITIILYLGWTNRQKDRWTSPLKSEKS